MSENRPDSKKSIGRRIIRIVLIAVIAVIASLCLLKCGVCLYYFNRPPKTVVTDSGKTVYEYYRGLDRVKTMTEYDTDGLMTKRTKYDDEGMILTYSDFFYDADGNLTEEREYDWEEFSGVIEYGADGLAIRKIRYSDEKICGTDEYEYDADGKLIREKNFDETGKLLGWYEYEYESGGKRRRWDHYDAYGVPTNNCDYYEY